MLLRRRMIDRSDYGIAILAMVYGWGTSFMLATWFALPAWAQNTIQATLTLMLGLGALTVQHFWRRYLQRRWPDQRPPNALNSETKI